jgi:hypothetical protein
MTQTTDRLGLPLLVAGQAQKEVTHNEALTLVDMLIQPTVQSVGLTTPPASPSPGQCWIIGQGAVDTWAGHDNALASYTLGGWRFIVPQEGMQAWSLADSTIAVYTDAQWGVGHVNVASINVNNRQVVGAQQSAIASPNGGTTIDSQARTTIASILAALQAHGLIAS